MDNVITHPTAVLLFVNSVAPLIPSNELILICDKGSVPLLETPDKGPSLCCCSREPRAGQGTDKGSVPLYCVVLLLSTEN